MLYIRLKDTDNDFNKAAKFGLKIQQMSQFGNT